MTNWAELAKELKTQLCIKTEIIGFKRFENPDEIDQIIGLKRMTRFFVMCQMIFQARRWGFTWGRRIRTPCTPTAPAFTG